MADQKHCTQQLLDSRLLRINTKKEWRQGIKCLTGKGAKAKLPSLHFFEEGHLYIPNIFLSFLRSVSLYAAKFFHDNLWENSVMETSTWLFSFPLYSWFISYSDQTLPCGYTTYFLPKDKLRLFWQINVLTLDILCLLFNSEIFVFVIYLFIYHRHAQLQKVAPSVLSTLCLCYGFLV